MSKNLKKTLYLSLAVMSFLASGSSIAYASNKSTSSSAKSSASSKKQTSSSNKDSSSDDSSTSTSKNNVTIVSTKKLPKQKYDKVLTGKYVIFNKPGTVSGAKVSQNKAAVKKLVDQKAAFMAYQVAKTSNGLTYYKVVSLHHSVRGWIYASGISNLNRTSKSDKKTTKKNKTSAKQNAETNNLNQINSLLSAIQDSLSQAQSTTNSNDSSTIDKLIQQANVKLNSAKKLSTKLTDSDDKDSIALKISQAASKIQDVQDSIQNKATNADNANLSKANGLVSNAYNSLNNVKLYRQNSALSSFDTVNQMVLSQNDLQNATTTANLIQDTTTKTNALNNINSAVQYMTTLANNANIAGIDIPTTIPSNDTIRYALITHYTDKARSFIDDVKANTNATNSSVVNNDISNAKAALQVAYNLTANLQDNDLKTNANNTINNVIIYLQATTLPSTAINTNVNIAEFVGGTHPITAVTTTPATTTNSQTTTNK